MSGRRILVSCPRSKQAARRAAAIRDVLARSRPTDGRSHDELIDRSAERPNIALLLAIDREYRRAAAADELRRIAPRRFNPRREARLPMMHVEREAWAFTALFSNTPRAHESRVRPSWVVLYYQPHHADAQATVVTEWRGALRVVRGRERECAS